MDRTTQQGSKVRRPLSARANWSLQPELTPTSLWRNTYTCMKAQWQADQRRFCCASEQSWRSVRCLWQQSAAFNAHRYWLHLQWQRGYTRGERGSALIWNSLAFTFFALIWQMKTETRVSLYIKSMSCNLISYFHSLSISYQSN